VDCGEGVNARDLEAEAVREQGAVVIRAAGEELRPAPGLNLGRHAPSTNLLRQVHRLRRV
jgi:hypothetical protein